MNSMNHPISKGVSMPQDDETRSYIVDISKVPQGFPTHLHSAPFWEELGRVVATFGFLEQTLGKAIFAITATVEYSEEAVSEALEKWSKEIQGALSDPLGAKIAAYERAWSQHTGIVMGDLDELVSHLREAAKVRNALCHGSWGFPDLQGRSVPFFVDRKLRKFETPVDVAFLEQTQQHVVELCVNVMNSVTTMGYQFPGSGGPGEPVWRPKS